MASMNVSVPDTMRDWVQSRIDSGRYASISDYVRDLIRRDQSLADQDIKFAALDDALIRGLSDADAGLVLPADTVFDRLTEKYAAMAATRETR
ncbi:type II toxin-antitoxin system ParD family antitoxin [Novosphingobium sp.]|uniref:type II toxin-antitoxin system ParD family antitoxin n=1 Tax=Novosphingobium sp. TaxID=1874826 RepID=UPI00333E58B2